MSQLSKTNLPILAGKISLSPSGSEVFRIDGRGNGSIGPGSNPMADALAILCVESLVNKLPALREVSRIKVGKSGIKKTSFKECLQRNFSKIGPEETLKSMKEADDMDAW